MANLHIAGSTEIDDSNITMNDLKSLSKKATVYENTNYDGNGHQAGTIYEKSITINSTKILLIYSLNIYHSGGTATAISYLDNTQKIIHYMSNGSYTQYTFCDIIETTKGTHKVKLLLSKGNTNVKISEYSNSFILIMEI